MTYIICQNFCLSEDIMTDIIQDIGPAALQDDGLVPPFEKEAAGVGQRHSFGGIHYPFVQITWMIVVRSRKGDKLMSCQISYPISFMFTGYHT